MTKHLQQIFGFGIETTEGQDPITGTSNYMIFGHGNQSKGNFSNSVTEHQVDHKGLLPNPTNTDIKKFLIEDHIGMMPVNGLPWYMILGNTINTLENTFHKHIMNGLGEAGAGAVIGDGKTYTVRFETSDDGSDSIVESAKGCAAKSLTFRLDTLQSLPAMTAAIGFDALSLGVATVPTLGTLPHYPTDQGSGTGTEQIKPYIAVDGNFVCTWDEGGDDIDYSNDLLSIEVRIEALNSVHHVIDMVDPTNTPKPKWIFKGQRLYSMSMQIRRGNDTSIYDDYLVHQTTGDKYDMEITVFHNGETQKYLTLDLIGISLEEVKMNHADPLKGDGSFYDVVATFDNIIVTAVDNVHYDYYDGVDSEP